MSTGSQKLSKKLELCHSQLYQFVKNYETFQAYNVSIISVTYYFLQEKNVLEPE